MVEKKGRPPGKNGKTRNFLIFSVFTADMKSKHGAPPVKKIKQKTRFSCFCHGSFVEKKRTSPPTQTEHNTTLIFNDMVEAKRASDSSLKKVNNKSNNFHFGPFLPRQCLGTRSQARRPLSTKRFNVTARVSSYNQVGFTPPII